MAATCTALLGCHSDSSPTASSDAALLWTAYLSHRSHGFGYVDGRIVSSDLGGVGAYDIATGQDAWYQSAGVVSLGGIAFGLGGRSVFIRVGDTVTALRARDGARLWTLAPTSGAVSGGPEITYAVVADTLLVALEAATGQVRRAIRLRTELEGGGVVAADERGVCVGLGPAIPVRFASRLACYDVSANERWYRRDVFDLFALTADLVVLGISGTLVAFDRATGEEIWRTDPIDVSYLWGLPADVHRVYACDDDPGACAAVDLKDGTVVWRWNAVGRIEGRPAVGETSLYVATLGGLIALDPETGAVRTVIPPPDPEIGFYGGVAYGDGIVVAHAFDLLYAYPAP